MITRISADADKPARRV